MSLTPRERVLAALSHRRPDRTPFELSFTPPMLDKFREETGATDPDDYFDLDIRTVGLQPTKHMSDFSRYLPETMPEGTVVDEWGVAHRPGSMYHFTKMIHPLQAMTTMAELEEYPFPDVTAEYRYAHLPEQVEGLHSAGYFVQGFAGHIFEMAWYMRGMENLLADLVLNPEFATALLDRITDINSVTAKKLAQAGVDMLKTGDDVGTQKAMLMSPDMWRQWFKPRLARGIAAAKGVNPDIHVWYHSDGMILPIIPDLIEIGVDVLNPIQPECIDPEMIKREYGDQISLWGTIGTQSIMPFGTPQEVREYTKDRIRRLGYNGGLVLAPTHVLEPDVPWENVIAFVETAREFTDF
ncbi:MAG: hypothetical protein GX030_01570 [Firmicutes bacterium]|nr:hypothetical protein [Bacillota bacterium]